MLEEHPAIIPGNQIDPTNEDPPRFVLLRREMPVGGWSLDHLYVDQYGVLTLVETKLLQNPESRRGCSWSDYRIFCKSPHGVGFWYGLTTRRGVLVQAG